MPENWGFTYNYIKQLIVTGPMEESRDILDYAFREGFSVRSSGSQLIETGEVDPATYHVIAEQDITPLIDDLLRTSRLAQIIVQGAVEKRYSAQEERPLPIRLIQDAAKTIVEKGYSEDAFDALVDFVQEGEDLCG